MIEVLQNKIQKLQDENDFIESSKEKSNFFNKNRYLEYLQYRKRNGEQYPINF